MSLDVTKQTPTTIGYDAPPEPPYGSVVVDRDGTAWQARWTDRGSLWSSAGIRLVFNFSGNSEGGTCRWLVLLAERGPLTLVHRTDA